MDHSLMAKELASFNESVSRATQDHLRQRGHSDRLWQNLFHWRRKWWLPLTFLLQEPHEQYEKAKRYDTRRWAPQIGKCPKCYWGSGCMDAHSCPTLCSPIECNLPGSSIHGIFQARMQEWVAISHFQWIFLTQGSNPHLWHLLNWQADSLPLSHLGKSRGNY